MPQNIAVFGGSFNPPGRHHLAVAERLAQEFDEVVIVPCGPRPDKPITNDVEPIHRAAMVDMVFGGRPKILVDLFDLEARTFTRTHQLDEIFAPRGAIWHVVGGDLVQGGRSGDAPIQRQWERGREIWARCNFAVIKRPGYPLDESDLPPNRRVIEVNWNGSSSDLRDRVFKRQPIAGLTTPKVAAYIERHNLYRGTRPPRQTRLSINGSRMMVLADEANPRAMEIAATLPPSEENDPGLIVVVGGDGMMLRSIREHWRRRIPFYGINAGHMGFLLNERPPAEFAGREIILQQLPLLRAEMETPSGETKSALAFNDAWVERSSGQTAWIQVKVNGQERLAQLVADGALVATAAGSTSYARAMGGPPLPLNTPAILLVGSNVLKPKTWQPVVLPPESSVELTNLEPTRRPICGFIDGVDQGEVLRMTARASNIAAVELAFDPDQDPAEKLAQLQFPA